MNTRSERTEKSSQRVRGNLVHPSDPKEGAGCSPGHNRTTFPQVRCADFSCVPYVLVDESLKHNDATIVSIFVNPAQFAPHEDLSTYPRTLESDLSSLSTCSYTPQSSPTPRKVSALFLPPVEALYPSGITTEVSKQRGTFIEVKGLQDSMEGKSRPGFFRGVATVVLKLFNLVQVRLPLQFLPSPCQN